MTDGNLTQAGLGVLADIEAPGNMTQAGVGVLGEATAVPLSATQMMIEVLADLPVPVVARTVGHMTVGIY